MGLGGKLFPFLTISWSSLSRWGAVGRSSWADRPACGGEAPTRGTQGGSGVWRLFLHLEVFLKFHPL